MILDIKNKWLFVVPTTETNDIFFLGNYIAVKRKGYYNGNKVSWHVTKVMWITGLFPAHDNYECEFARNIGTTFGIENNDFGTMSLSIPSDDFEGYAFVTIDCFGDMSKPQARALMKKMYNADNSQTISYECPDYRDVTTAIKHTHQAIELKSSR